MKHNPVARHAHRFNRCQRHKTAKQYQRNDKHKARQNDLSGPSCLWAGHGRWPAMLLTCSPSRGWMV